MQRPTMLAGVTIAGASAALLSCGRVDFGAVHDAAHDGLSRDAVIDGSSDATVDAPPTTGCSDGSRDEFVDLTALPRIAGCAGGWSLPGVLDVRSTCPATGDDSSNPSGQGCAAVDLCSPGWHVCNDQNAVADRLNAPSGCTDLLQAINVFYVTRQGSSGSGQCDGGGTNDMYGCGSASVTGGSCLPLDASTNDQCTTMPPGWSCPTTNTTDELLTVVHDGTHGGVLCCAP